MAYYNGKEWVSQTPTVTYPTTTPKKVKVATQVDTMGRTSNPQQSTPKFSVPSAPSTPSSNGKYSGLAAAVAQAEKQTPDTPGEKSVSYPIDQGANTPAYAQIYKAVYDPWTDPQAYYDKIMSGFESKKQQGLSNLRAAYDKMREEADSQKTGVEQGAVTNLNANDAMYYTQMLPQMYAASEQAGGYRGGEQLKNNSILLATRGQNASNIMQDKETKLNAIRDAINSLNEEQALKEIELSSANDAAAAEAAIQGAQNAINNNMNLANLTGTINGGQTLAAMRQAYDQSMGIADRTGKMPDGSTTMTYQQMQEDNSVRRAQLAEQIRQFNLNFGLDSERMDIQKVQQQLDEKYRNRQISLSERNQKLNEAQQLFNQQQTLYSNTQQQQQTNQSNMQYYSDQIAKMMGETSGTGLLGTTVRKYTDDQIRAYIASLPISDTEAQRLLDAFGL
jgi:hypothetical protein